MYCVHYIYIQSKYNRQIKSFFLAILILVGSHLLAAPKTTESSVKSNATNEDTSADSLKIAKLAQLAFYYYDYLGNKKMADSIALQAISIAEATYRPSMLIFAYNKYIESNEISYNLPKARHYALEAVRLSKQSGNTHQQWHSIRNLVKVYLAAYTFDKAMGNSYEAYALADALEDEALKAESYLLIGQSLEGNNQKIEAFRNYLNAASLAEKSKNKELLKQSYSLLSNFYNHNKLYDKAIEYKLLQVDLIRQSIPVDSVELMWAQYDLQAININSNNNQLNTKSIKEVFEFAIRNNHQRLKNYEIALYRSHLIEAEKISQLILLYRDQYPTEFAKLSAENPSLYYRLLAYFNEENNKPDSAYYNLLRSEELIQSDPNKILKSNFYQRFGQFLVRQGKPEQAVEKYLLSFDLAQQASYFEYMLSASKNLEALYARLGDYTNAYKYSALNRSLNDSISILTQNDQLLMLEIDHETKQRQLAAEMEHELTHRRHNLQYMAITLVIIAMFILLLMLGTLKVPAWVIKMLGFFSFILLFEFIIMIADHKIYEITANEPWKILLIKIGLIAFLLPFHHWIEKKVIHFLIDHELINSRKNSVKNIIIKALNRNKQTSSIDNKL